LTAPEGDDRAKKNRDMGIQVSTYTTPAGDIQGSRETSLGNEEDNAEE
jgi:hypothetical protein